MVKNPINKPVNYLLPDKQRYKPLKSQSFPGFTIPGLGVTPFCSQFFFCILSMLFLPLGVVFHSEKSLAQVFPPTFPRDSSPLPRDPQPLPQPAPEIPLDTPPPPQPPQPDIPGVINVVGFEFKGNESQVFTEEELQEVVKPYLGEISFSNLLQAEAAVTQLYIEAGYINSGAVIPAGQTFDADMAVITIQIIEGGIEDIIVTVDGRLNPNYVKKRLALATKTPLNQQDLLEALQLLQLDPVIEQISAKLSTGITPELSLLEVEVIEADTFRVSAIADNGRVPSVGSFRRGVVINSLNLSGRADNLRLEYINTDGSDTYDGRYQIPVNARNAKVTLSGRFTDSQVIEPPFDELNITGDTLYYDLSFQHPVIQTPFQELTLGITASRAASKTTILGVGFPLSLGAEDDGDTKISALRFFQEWTKRNPRDIVVVRSQFSLGIDALNATTNAELPDSRFFSWRGQGQYVKLLAPDTLFVLRSDIQLSTTSLLALEQFALGGLYTVRGYRQDALLTDNGFFTSAEVRIPVLRIQRIEGVFQVVPFVDFGVGWNNQDNPIATFDPNTLIGVGVGLAFQASDRVTARFDWGIPLTEVRDGDRTWQENGLYFSINLTLF